MLNFSPFKGRSAPAPGTVVRLYRNLTTNRVAIRVQGGDPSQGPKVWAVCGDCDAASVTGGTFFVSLKTSATCRAMKKREVHAWVEGCLSVAPPLTSGSRVSYNPHGPFADHFYFSQERSAITASTVFSFVTVTTALGGCALV